MGIQFDVLRRPASCMHAVIGFLETTMRALLIFKPFRVAAIVLVGVGSASAAVASEISTPSGYVRYTTGTGAVRNDHSSQRMDVISQPMPSQNIGQWQVASVDASALAGQASMIGIKPATFELPPRATYEAGTAAASGPVLRSVDATRGKEPGFWAPALSTLALALFFFLRRLA